MRVFVVLSALVALAAAAPQYGYESAGSHDSFGLLNPFQGGHGHGRGGDKYLPPAATTPAPSVHKQFFLVSAPEDHGNEGKVKHLVLGRPQKNYRVVFIKAPSPGSSNIRYSAEYAPQEEKTVIYVLSKKENELEANDIVTPAPTQPSKPEVFFIKYKTEEEAIHAQREIQGEYDKLGGTKEVSDEGTAPITSVIGSLDSLNADGSYNYRKVNSDVASERLIASSNYLPPNSKQ